MNPSSHTNAHATESWNLETLSVLNYEICAATFMACRLNASLVNATVCSTICALLSKIGAHIYRTNESELFIESVKMLLSDMSVEDISLIVEASSRRRDELSVKTEHVGLYLAQYFVKYLQEPSARNLSDVIACACETVMAEKDFWTEVSKKSKKT